MQVADRFIDKAGHALMRDFGAFYPTGHTVVAFQEQQEADQVLKELQAMGGVFVDCVEYSPAQMAEFAEHNLQESGVIASLGTSMTTVGTYLDAARDGATFLIVPTPDDMAAERVMEMVHHAPSFLLAQRYRRFAIEEMH
jgi:hypothetical protein